MIDIHASISRETAPWPSEYWIPVTRFRYTVTRKECIRVLADRKMLVAVALAAASLLAVARPAHATDFELMDARSLGMGGALRASAFATSALYMNPAGIAMSKSYHVESSYIFDDKYDMHMVGASVVDSITSRLGMGLGYFFKFVGEGKQSSELQLHNLFLGLAYAIIPQLSLGMSLHYKRAEIDTPRPDELEPDADLNPYGRDLSHFSLDAGLTIRIIRNHLGIAVVGYNLTHIKSPLAPIMLGLSIYAQVSIFQVSFDVLLDFWSGRKLLDSDEKVWPRYMIGAEAFIADHWPLRTGYAWSDLTGSHSIHAGAGYVGEKGALEAGLSYEVNEGFDHLRDLRLVLSVKYFAF